MTATHNAPHTAHGGKGAARAPEPIDPEHDIDARSTTIWFIASTVVLFVSLYFMLPLFDLVLSTERARKIDDLPAVELQEVKEHENAFLLGGDNTKGITIEKVMQGMVK